jgi:phospholipid/cholesterol/gamma-HCH transport system substrate-binding protein
MIQIVEWLNRPIDNALQAIDEFRKSQLYGYGFTTPVVRLLNNAGLQPGVDIDSAMDKALTNLDDYTDSFKLLPVMWENIPPPPQDGQPLSCSRGHAQLPEDMDVLLNGQRVVLCNR